MKLFPKKVDKAANLAFIEEIKKPFMKLQKMSERDYNFKEPLNDNGFRTLQIFVHLGLTAISGRGGNDAEDEDGNEYEIKTMEYHVKRRRGFSTSHYLTCRVVSKYRKVHWVFGFFQGLELISIYLITPGQLDPFFDKWEAKLKTTSPLNDPPIPMKFVKEHGKLCYSKHKKGNGQKNTLLGLFQ